MAFLPEKTYLEETLVNNYNLSAGPASFVSSDISKYITFSIHFICTNILGFNNFILEQSNDNLNWAFLSDDIEIIEGNSNFIIDKNNFTGKYL